MTERRAALLVALAVTLGYGWFSRFSEEVPNPNEASRMYLTLAIVDDRSLAIDGPMDRHGVVLDHARRRGHFYSDKAPGMAFAGVPLYAAAHGWIHAAGEAHVLSRLHRCMRWGLTILPTALFAGLLFLALRRHLPDPALRATLVLAWAFASPARWYGDLIFGHQTAGLLAASSLLALDAGTREEERRSWIAAAGCLAGATFMFEYLGAAVVPGGALLLLLRRRLPALAAYLAAAAVPVALTLAYHRAAFGGAFTPGYATLGTGYAAAHAGGLFGVHLPSLEGVAGLTFSLHRGLFVTAPWLLASVPGALLLSRAPQERPFALALAATSLAWGLLAAGFVFWDGGAAPGPRHIVAILPLLTMFAAPAVAAIARRGAAARLTYAALVAASLLVTALVASTFFYFQPAHANPFVEVTLAHLLAGDVTPNAGAAFGLEGAWSLAPHALFTVALAAFSLRALATRPAPGAPSLVSQRGATSGTCGAAPEGHGHDETAARRQAFEAASARGDRSGRLGDQPGLRRLR